MNAIFLRAACLVGVILLGIILRRTGYFKKEDFIVLSKISIRITLTCAIIRNFNGNRLDYSMFLLTLIALLFGTTLIILGIVLHRKGGRDAQSFALLNESGCNIGNFALPFVQNFLGPAGLIAVSLFDVGNSMICLGGSYSTASIIKNPSDKLTLKRIFKPLLSSVPLMTYVVMVLLSVLHLSLPTEIMGFVDIIADANPFMAMFMIGVGFELTGKLEHISTVVKILLTRYTVAIIFALISWFILPLPLEYRQALVIVLLAPIAAAAPGFTAELGGNYGLASTINSISIIISIVLITTVLMVIL